MRRNNMASAYRPLHGGHPPVGHFSSNVLPGTIVNPVALPDPLTSFSAAEIEALRARGWLTDRRKGWIPCAEERPDADTTVLIYCPLASEPVWLGFLDGDTWRLVDGSSTERPVTHWMHLPEGPNR